MADNPGDDPFDGFEITEEWASEARRTEETAEQRAARYAKINQGHQRAVSDLDAARKRKRRRLRWNWRKVIIWLIFAGICAAVVGVYFLLNRGSRSSLAQRSVTTAPAGLEERGERILPAVSSNGSKDFTIAATNPDGSAVTFSPCRPWHVVVNIAGAPKGAYQVVASALETVSKDTGLQLVLDSTTNEPVSANRAAYQPDRYGERWAPILVGWTSNKENGFAGHGGPITVTKSSTGQANHVSGIVSLDADGTFNRNPAQLRAIILHELGHVVGLSHAASSTELMAPVNDGQIQFGPGD
ncbi:MAG: matrixin family metalloprotease, partial [Actinomycetes bacterium]